MAPGSCASSELDSESSLFSDASPSLFSSDFPLETRLRGLRWRAFLGVFPPYPAPIEALRRAAANGRRRYAELRRRLIVDPHMMEDLRKADHRSMDNPLSQDPESVWGRFFRNAEVQRIIESDLALLYPEHGSFFQSFGCQAMLRRILLVWALAHPQYGYQQGMHELLAPLVYVLRVDVTHLSQVRQRYEDPFEDRFDTPLEDNFSFSSEGRQTTSFSAHSSLERTISSGDEDWIGMVHPEDSALVEPDDLGFNLKTMLLGSDSYGTEGELGALLSGRFVEHDAYCMFDALLREGGAVALADYFMTVNEVGSTGGLSPVLEASAAVYHALATVDMSLYIHLSRLGVEPQFFALRWLRVLFSREFDLEKLLFLWDAIFAAPNSAITAGGSEENREAYKDLPLGSFISCFAVSMLLYVRPTLLAAPNATSCLQKLLRFPKNADIRSLIENAKTLQSLAEADMRIFQSPVAKFGWIFESSRGGRNRSGSLSPPFQSNIPVASKVLQRHFSGSPEMTRPPMPESYWEERWINSVLPSVLPEVICGVQNMEADAEDILSAPSSSNTFRESKTKQAKGSDYSDRSFQVHHTDVSNKPTKRMLLTGPAEAAASLLHPEDRRGDTTLSRSGSPLDSEASTKSEIMTNANDKNSASTARAAPGEITSQLAESDPLRGYDGETSLCRHEGDSAALEYSASTQATNGTTCANDLSSTLKSAAEECQGSSIKSCFQHEIRISQLKEKPNGIAKLPVSYVNMAAYSKLGSHASKTNDYEIATTENQENADSLMKNRNIVANTVTIREKGSRIALQTLGHSMVENIQVLESALTHRSCFGKDGAASGEKSELFLKTFLSGKAHATVLSALAELRRISNLLLQM